MNKQDLMKKRNDAMRTIRHSNKIGSHRNAIRISTANSLEHEITKLKICYNLMKEGKEFITEAIFNNGSRADILVLDDYKIIEILYSEKEAACLEKSKRYPALFVLEMIRAYDTKEMTNPKCPDCGKRLVKIPGTDGEYFCSNDECPANIREEKLGLFGHVEYYGTQKEINKQQRVNHNAS